METEFVVCPAGSCDVKQEIPDDVDPLADSVEDSGELIECKVEVEDMFESADYLEDKADQSADCTEDFDCDIIVKQEIIEVVEDMKIEIDEDTKDVKNLNLCELGETNLTLSNCWEKKEKSSPKTKHPKAEPEFERENLVSQSLEKTERVKKKKFLRVEYRGNHSQCSYTSNQAHHLKYHTVSVTGEKVFKCEFCNKLFIRTVNFKKRKSHQTKRKPYKCDTCDKTFTKLSSLNAHKCTHPKGNPFKCALFFYAGKVKLTVKKIKKSFLCEVCGKMLSQLPKLNLHKLLHKEEKRYKCAECSYACNTLKSLEFHVKKHTKEKCSFCTFTGTNKAVLKQHMMKHKNHRCVICDSSFSTYNDLLIHKRIHRADKPYKCTLCSYVCKIPSSLKVHMRKHTGEKPYKCKVCDKAFSQSAHLRTHTKGRHSGEKPYKCKMCDWAFILPGYLRSHMKTCKGKKSYNCTLCVFPCRTRHDLQKHMTTTHNVSQHKTTNNHTQNVFKCEVCDRSFLQLRNLHLHKVVHNGEKPFKCTHCDHACKHASGLLQHVRSMHSGEKAFKCNVCNKRFSQSGHLRLHQRIHTGEKPYQCAHCGFASSYKANLRDHISLHMTGKPFKSRRRKIRKEDPKQNTQEGEQVRTAVKPTQD